MKELKTIPLKKKRRRGFLFSVFCTDNKNLSTENACTILAVYYALDSSASFKPALIDFVSVFDMLALSAV